MSNRPLALLASLIFLSSPRAVAQSRELLDAVRLHRKDATALAERELKVCLQARCPDAGRLALLAATLRLSEGDAVAARAHLNATAPDPALAAYHAFYAGQAAFYAGDPATAALSFLTALQTAPPSLIDRARARAGEALLAAGRPEEALPHLDQAVAALGGPELRWQRASANGQLGKKEEQARDLRALVIDAPSHPYGVAALEPLAAVDPRPLTFAERLQRAANLLEDAPKDALAEVAVLRKQKLPRTRTDYAKVALIAQKAHLALGELDAAHRESRRAERGPAEVASEAAYLWARTALKADDNKTARTRMASVWRKYPQTSSGREAGFYVGWLSFQMEELERAIRELGAYADKLKKARTRRRDEARWYRALALMLLERPADARVELQQLAQDAGDSPLLPQILYWSARTLQQSNGAAEAVDAEYRRVVELFPASFYAVLATQRLRDQKAEVPVAFPDRPSAPAAESSEALALGFALSRAGLLRDADLELAAQTARIRDPQAAIGVAHALSSHQEYALAYRMAQRSLWGEAFGKKNGAALALFFPRPFASAVEPESRAHGLDPYFTWAIMKSESVFRPELVSAANARGLMMLVPPTANAVAKELGLPPPDPDALYSPALNVRLGTWYLGKLLERFRHPAGAAAAYNAGPPAAERWAKEHGGRPLDLFAELISYRETRAYVKQVLADLHVYRALYEGGGVLPPIPLEVPEVRAEGVRF